MPPLVLTRTNVHHTGIHGAVEDMRVEAEAKLGKDAVLLGTVTEPDHDAKVPPGEQFPLDVESRWDDPPPPPDPLKPAI